MITRANFRIQFPEFNSATDALVDATLARAEKRIDPEVWGPHEDEGHALLTAHLLAISPFGQNARLSSEKGKSTYGVEYEALRETVTTGIRTIVP